MKYIGLITSLILFCAGIPLAAQVTEKPAGVIPATFCVSTLEYKLYNMINAYRQRYDLPSIPLSKSLSFVASTHVRDLYFHHPDQGSCNAHSWSDQGTWKPFCYPRDENKKSSVWDKPRELTEYKGKGYEIVYWENSATVIDSIIAFWKSMDYFNSFLMNNGKWQGKRWNAIGIGIYENYACAWFGELADPSGEPFICGQEPAKAEFHENGVPPGKKEPVTPGTGQKDPVHKGRTEPAKPIAKPVVPAVATPLVAGKEYYFIIVKGVAPEKELERVLKDLQSKGYPGSRIVEKNEKKRVSIMEFPNKSKADSALRIVKKSFPDAWLLKQ
jgi:hypothetical protein